MLIREHDFVDIATPTGPMRTHLFCPAEERRYPGVVLFSEIFQVTGPIRRTAAWLAGNGFLVAVPEIYHEYEPAGTVLPYDEAGGKRGNELKVAKPVAAYDSDARAVLDFLRKHPSCSGNLGTLGICIGGHLAFRAAMNPEVLASTCFYATDIHGRTLGQGKSDDTLDRMAEIKGEMLMIWGRQDPHIPLEGRRIIHAAMEQAGLCFQWHEFNGAHAFIRDEGPRYNPVLAAQCLGLAVEMFQRRLAS